MYALQFQHKITYMLRIRLYYLITITIVLFSFVSAEAHELTDKLSLNGVLSGALQCQQLLDDTIGDDTCKTAIPFQPTLTYRPSQHDRLFLKLGFATSNGLDDVSPFNIRSWGADLEDEVVNINGSGRSYILTAWYEHVFELDAGNSVDLTLGIIDASQYLDQNAYADDEYRQFMNPALSNAPNAFFPSYDLGIASEWYSGKWTFTGVLMDVNQVKSNETYLFYGLQVSYRLDTALGTGNYRVLLNGDRDFISEAGTSKRDNDVLIISADQQLGDTIGAFARFGRRLDDESIKYQTDFSAGVDIKGTTWGRMLDNIGAGVVYLEGGDGIIISTRIVETYYRMVINSYLAFTADIQYMRDQYYSVPDAEGIIYSVRATVNF